MDYQRQRTHCGSGNGGARWGLHCGWLLLSQASINSLAARPLWPSLLVLMRLNRPLPMPAKLRRA